MKQFKTPEIFATIKIPDGYFGHTCVAGLALIGLKPVAVHSFGYHSLGLPDCLSKGEVLWLIKNHPNFRDRIKLIEEVKHETV